MRTKLILFCMIICLFSCKNNNEQDIDSETNQTESIDRDNENPESPDYAPIDQMETTPDPDTTDSSEKTDETSSKSLSGTYIRNDHPEDWNCSCFCIEVTMTGTSELCLSKDKLYINGRFEQNGNNIDIYYSGKSSKTGDSDLPWDKFEKNTPIAVLSPSANGFDLDWKGFTINGEIAIDYALYGKKTLEGTYKRK
ncbi:hypothetical protein [Gramella sp. KN1008]|uniref:hypothetical protein n=1 Tax=Gramella sp. KN1008 TaxID=2529298 RepID=UPI00103A4CAB|nr:hypothetical protein [Gramella sp. KN1008]TBW27551.1 hypothetical protein EZJ28_11310 [Gramella sp. KN1008]